MGETGELLTVLSEVQSFISEFLSTASDKVASFLSSASCTGCSNVFPLSIVGVVGQTQYEPTRGATRLSTMTQKIGFITLDGNGNVQGTFFTALWQIPASPLSWESPISGTLGLYPPSYLTALSTIVQDYYSWQDFKEVDNCVDTSKFFSFDSTVTFLADDITLVKGTSPDYADKILGSAVQTRLPRPTCITTSLEVSTTTIPIPTVIAAAQTFTIQAGDFQEDSQIPVSVKIALGLVFGLSVGLILGFLAFFLWKRRKISQQQPHVSSQTQSRSELGNQGYGSQTKVQEVSVSEVVANTHEIKRRSWERHWRAPMLMLGGILLGVVFVLGHHFFYASIHMQPVDDIYLSQAWVIRFGTLLAFLVKICLAATVATSFVQLQWLELRRKPWTVKDIDVLSSVLGNILSYLNYVWLQYRSLTLLAAVFWLLPLLPVITPGTLNVRSLAHQQETLMVVPKFTPENDSIIEPWGSLALGPAGTFITIDPSPGLAQVYVPAAFRGEILPMIPQYPNQSFHLDFHGPAVNCSQADESVVLSMTQGYGFKYNSTTDNGSTPFYVYYSWVPGNEYTSQNAYARNIDLVSQDAARIFVLSTVRSGPAPNVTINGESYWLPKVTECSLYNASYSVDFSFQNSEQTVVTNVSFLHNVAAPPMAYTLRPPAASLQSYWSLMAGLGNTLIGSILNMTGYITSKGITNEYTRARYLSQIFVDGTYTNDQISDNIEEMFRNMTLSLVTSRRPYFTTNQTVVGNVTSYLITYIYNPLGLFLTYGIAFVLSLLCAAIGFYAFTINDGSYQNLFSTFLRATKHTRLIIEDGDEGKDPLPKTLGRATVQVTPKHPQPDPWLQSPVQRHILVREPQLSHNPTTRQQEQLKNRHPSSPSGMSDENTFDGVEVSKGPETPLRQQT